MFVRHILELIYLLDKQEALSVLRTVLAYERNILSIERTQLAQLRTGLALALITPTAIATFTYAFEFLPKDYPISILLYILLIIITFYGVAMASTASWNLRKTRQIKKKVKEKRRELLQRSDSIDKLLSDVLNSA